MPRPGVSGSHPQPKPRLADAHAHDLLAFAELATDLECWIAADL